MSQATPRCELCDQPGGTLIASTPAWRLVRVLDDAFPAFYRVIWSRHVAELSDLSTAEQQACLAAVVAVERVLRARLQPTKVNLASLGNVVPHLHWHVVARFDWDSHFPNPIWAASVRPAAVERLQALVAALPALDQAVAAACLASLVASAPSSASVSVSAPTPAA